MAKNHRVTTHNKNKSSRMIQNLQQSMLDPSIQIRERNTLYEKGELDNAISLWLDSQSTNPDNRKGDSLPGEDKKSELVELQQALKESVDQQLKNMTLVCNGIWRIQQNVNLSIKEQSTSRLLRTKRHVDTLVEQIGTLGYSFKDHTGEVYDTGNKIMVLSTEPTEGLTSEKVIETVKPSVFYKGELLQSGEVIVGTPLSE